LTLFDDEDERSRCLHTPRSMWCRTSRHVMSLKSHPVPLSGQLRTLHAVSAAEHRCFKTGSTSGSPSGLGRQRPGTASERVSFTLEDNGTINLIVWASCLMSSPGYPGSKLLMRKASAIERECACHRSACYNLNYLLGLLTTTESDDLPLLTPARG